MRTKEPDDRVKSGERKKAGLVTLPWITPSHVELQEIAADELRCIIPDESTVRTLEGTTVATWDEGGTCPELPTEFALRELLALDVDSSVSLLRFVSTYGIVAAPYFNSLPRCLGSERIASAQGKTPNEELILCRQLIKDEIAAVSSDAPDGFRPQLAEAAWKSEAGRLALRESMKGGRYAISLEELRETLALLRESIALFVALDVSNGDLDQTITTMLNEGVMPKRITGNLNWPWLSLSPQSILNTPDSRQTIFDMKLAFESKNAIANAYVFLNTLAFRTGAVAYEGLSAFLGQCDFSLGSGNEEHVYRREAERAQKWIEGQPNSAGHLGTALALQLIDLLQSGSSWKTCRNPSCSRLFKTYRQADGKTSTQRRRESVYCSHQCQTNARRALKSEAERMLRERLMQCQPPIEERSLDSIMQTIDFNADEINHLPRFLSEKDRKTQSTSDSLKCPILNAKTIMRFKREIVQYKKQR